MAHEEFKDLTKRAASDKLVRDKKFNIGKTLKYDGCQPELSSMVYKIFDKKASGSGIKNENISNKELAEEIHKPVIRKFKNRKAYSSFIDSIWGSDLT